MTFGEPELLSALCAQNEIHPFVSLSLKCKCPECNVERVCPSAWLGLPLSFIPLTRYKCTVLHVLHYDREEDWAGRFGESEVFLRLSRQARPRKDSKIPLIHQT